MTLMTFVYLIAGLVLLVAGAEVLVRGAAKLAAQFGIPPLIIGLDRGGLRHQRAGNRRQRTSCTGMAVVIWRLATWSAAISPTCCSSSA